MCVQRHRKNVEISVPTSLESIALPSLVKLSLLDLSASGPAIDDGFEE